MLVLGTRLGELTSFWNPIFVPAGGFIHVDRDPTAFGTAYPGSEILAVESDISVFLEALLANTPALRRAAPRDLPRPQLPDGGPPQEGRVRPRFLCDCVQQIFVDGSDAILMGEPGNSLAWANHLLRFAEPGRYRASLGFSSMGHTVTGVLGAAMASGKQAVTLAGDGAMLMLCEINTAVKYRLPVVWIVLNDAAYNMCDQGMTALGYKNYDASIPRADFSAIARGMGAQGIRVTNEDELLPALSHARSCREPMVVDVIIDATARAPFGARNQSLRAQGAALPNGARL
jgi:acetolactate synthase-1/2/3 large subunit